MSNLSATAFYPHIAWNVEAAFAQTQARPDKEFAERLCRSYRHQIESFGGFGGSGWKNIAGKNQHVHDALLASDIEMVAQVIADPTTTELFYGLESNLPGTLEGYLVNPTGVMIEVVSIGDRLIRLAEALGVSPLWYPESFGHRKEPVDFEALLAVIDSALGISVQFPNPYPREFGIQTSRGIMGFRAVQALYQAWRLKSLSVEYGEQIVEIGAGAGRTAFYAQQLGLSNYTTVDLPLGTMAQAAFLIGAVGPDHIVLPGEARKEKAIRIATPADLLEGQLKFDIAINVDSMTEMDRDHAVAYASVIANKAKAFISINHDVNGFRVGELEPLASAHRLRYPYWMRNGYAEEIYIFPRRRSWKRVFG